MNNQNVPGKGAAIGSLVCGIVSLVFSFLLSSLVITPLIGLVLGIIGLILASSAKKAGYNEGLRTAGFVLSLLGVIFGALVFVSCVACAGCLGAAGGLSALSTY